MLKLADQIIDWLDWIDETTADTVLCGFAVLIGVGLLLILAALNLDNLWRE